MKLIGWTHWFNPSFYYCIENLDRAIDLTVEHMKNNGLAFHGTYHQHGELGTPIFDNGEKLCLTLRSWGGVMAKVMGLEGEYAYAEWAWWIADEEKAKVPGDNPDKMVFLDDHKPQGRKFIRIGQGGVPVLKEGGPTMLIGWTNWFDPNYSECTENEDWAIELTIAHMKKKSLKFGGPYHQNGQNGVPAFDNKEKLCLPLRAWGALMADVMGIDNKFTWVWRLSVKEDQKLPDESDCLFKGPPPTPRIIFVQDK